jgi:hypothetical protein
MQLHLMSRYLLSWCGNVRALNRSVLTGQNSSLKPVDNWFQRCVAHGSASPLVKTVWNEQRNGAVRCDTFWLRR